jgi:hypothetical protein
VRFGAHGQKFQDDSVLGTSHPTSQWIGGEIVKDRRVLTLPSDGTYEPEIGVWLPRSSRHVGVGRWWGPRTAPFCRIVAAGASTTVGNVR